MRSTLIASVVAHTAAVAIAAVLIAGPTRRTFAPIRVELRTDNAIAEIAAPLEVPMVEPESLFEPDPEPEPIFEDDPVFEAPPEPPPGRLPPELLEPRTDYAPSESWYTRVRPAEVEPTAQLAPAPIEPAPPPAQVAEARVIEPDPGASPPPRYPPLARRRGWQGVVELLVEVAADGAVRGVGIHRSSGYALLDHAAQTAVRGWSFRHGPGAVTLPIEFRLR